MYISGDNSFDWLRFYESADNLRELRERQSWPLLGNSQDREITASLIQGRFYHAAAIQSPIEIRPLLIFYSMVAFSKAVAMFRTGTAADDLKRSHGFTAIPGSRVVELSASIHNAGTFQHLNDAVATIQKLPNLDYEPPYGLDPVYTHAATSATLFNKRIGLREVLARIGPLSALYEETFRESSKIITCTAIHKSYRREDGHVEMGLRVPCPLKEALDVQKCLESLQGRFPFLRQWTVIDITATSPIIAFSLTGGHFGIEENIRRMTLYEEDRRILEHQETLPMAEISEHTMYPPVLGMNGGPYFVESFEGLQISAMSLLYLGMGMLGSLVRYHPHLWVHALSRSAYETRPADDRAIAILDKFTELSLEAFPRMALEALLTPPQVSTK